MLSCTKVITDADSAKQLQEHTSQFCALDATYMISVGFVSKGSCVSHCTSRFFIHYVRKRVPQRVLESIHHYISLQISSKLEPRCQGSA